ncbi:MAG: peptide deformylase [Thermanaerothrix sp.]|nr:peptide deformylase [Thermanaerothrix sp.]
MARRQIVTVPDPILRRKAQKVHQFGADLQQLIDDMIETMRAAPGVGLAAPQVGASQRGIVVEYGEDEDENKPPRLYVVVNPEIVEVSAETEMGVEGCLSIPDLVGEVERYQRIVVKGQNRRGQPIKLKLQGWVARIFQHEIDHLEGVLFTDRAVRVWKPSPEEAMAVD